MIEPVFNLFRLHHNFHANLHPSIHYWGDVSFNGSKSDSGGKKISNTHRAYFASVRQFWQLFPLITQSSFFIRTS